MMQLQRFCLSGRLSSCVSCNLENKTITRNSAFLPGERAKPTAPCMLWLLSRLSFGKAV